MIKILWASPHKPTAEQLATLTGDVVYLKDVNPLLFDAITGIKWETAESALALRLFNYAKINGYAVLMQPAGSPLFQACLGACNILEKDSVMQIGYAFTQRVSVDESQPDGTVIKKSIFKHEGFKYLLR